MIKFKSTFKKLDINLIGAKKGLNDAIAEEVKQGMRAFLEAAIPKVPVYSGQARGTLRPLGRYLNVLIPISPTKAARKKHPGNTPRKGEDESLFEFKNEGFNHSVELKITLFYFIVNDFHGANFEGSENLIQATPWGALEAGRKAFVAYLKQNLKKKIPRINQYVTRTPITVG